MRVIWICTLLSVFLFDCHAAPASKANEKPAVMIGIKRSAISTSTTPPTTDNEPTPKPEKPQVPQYTKKPEAPKAEGETVNMKQEKSKVPNYTKKPIVPEKQVLAEKEKPIYAKKPETEKRSEEQMVLVPAVQEPATEKPALPLSNDITSSTPEVTPTAVTETHTEVSTVAPYKENAITDVYDNSQHGSDNYRVHVKGFTILVAPSETVIGAAMIMSGLGDMKDLGLAQPNPSRRSQGPKDQFSSLIQLLKRMKLSESH